MLQQKLINITIAIANNLQEKWQQNNITTETLMQLSLSIWDLMLAFFNKAFFLYNEINAHFKLTHTIFAPFMQLPSALENFSNYIIDSFYNCDWQLYVVAKNLIVVIVDFVTVLYYQIPSMDEIQQKWSQMNDQYKLIDTAFALFTQFLFAVQNCFEYLIHAFNDILPPENRDEIAKHYILAAVILILFIFLSIFLFWCLVWIVSCLFMIISSIVRLVFICIFSILKFLSECIISTVKYLFERITSTLKFLFECITSTVKFLFECIISMLMFLFGCITFTVKFLYSGVYSTFSFIKSCLMMMMMRCFYHCQKVKMMAAPGMAPERIVRAAFEADPQAYFAALRGRI